MDAKLRKLMIRLAHENPDQRDQLVPLLKRAAEHDMELLPAFNEIVAAERALGRAAKLIAEAKPRLQANRIRARGADNALDEIYPVLRRIKQMRELFYSDVVEYDP